MHSRYLIRFSVDAYVAKAQGTAGPHVGTGVGLAFGIAIMQCAASLAVNQFMYHSMVVGGQARAGVISMVFAKSLKISGRARAGGPDAGKPPPPLPTTPEGIKKARKEKGEQEKKGRDDEIGWSNGKVVNLMSTDTFRIDQCASWFHVLWSSPIQIVITLILLLINLSYSALAGFALLIIGAPILSLVVRVLATRRRKMTKITDKRVSLTQEIFMGVRFVKYFGWEKPFLSRLEELRRREIGAIRFLLGVRSGVMAVGVTLPVFASMLAFITYSLTDNRLDAASVFSSLALFNVLRLPLNLLPMVIAQTIDAWVSLGRLQDYLLAEELKDETTSDDNPDFAIEIAAGVFTWERSMNKMEDFQGERTKAERREDRKQRKQDRKDEAAREKHREDNPETATISTVTTTTLEPFTLKDIDLQVGRNELIAVVGGVGSGKSSLLAALAGDMRRTAGSVKCGARVAYCPQYAWIQNESVKENIVFGCEFDEPWYQEVVEACALQQDLDMLPAGDATEIGERGITLSGGQKQRINIARAIYFDADIVLLDDPLSAVDAHVGKHLFDKAICGLMSNKCRILATHQLHVINKVDRVVWMEDGKIEAVGTFDKLMETNIEFARMMGEIATEAQAEKQEETEKEAKDEIEETEVKEKKKPQQAKTLMQAEERGVSSVSWRVYEAYIRASGSILVAPLVVLLLCLSQASNIITTLWLGYWTSNKYNLPNGVYVSNNPNPDNDIND